MNIFPKKKFIMAAVSIILIMIAAIFICNKNMSNSSFAAGATIEPAVEFRFLNTQTKGSLDYAGNEANLMKTKDDKYVLIDTGNHNSSIRSIIKQALVDYQGDGQLVIDYLIISHLDGDHRGNAVEIINDDNILVKNVVIKCEKTVFEYGSGDETVKFTSYADILSAANLEGANIYTSSEAVSFISEHNYTNVNYVNREGYSIGVGSYLKLYFYNVSDVYDGRGITDCSGGIMMQWTRKSTVSNPYSFNSVDENTYYVSFNGEDYVEKMTGNDPGDFKIFNRENIESGLQSVSGNPTINSKFYAVAMNSDYSICRSNGNSYGVLAEVETDGDNKYVYFANDLDNYGYDIVPNKENINYYDKNGNVVTAQNHAIYGTGGGVLYKADDAYVAKRIAANHCDGEDNYSECSLYHYTNGLVDEDMSYRVASESIAALEIKSKIGENKLNDLVIYQQSHHGMNNAPDAIMTLNLNRPDLYAVANTQLDGSQQTRFGRIRANYVLNNAQQLRTGDKPDGKENGVYCVIDVYGRTACGFDDIEGRGLEYNANGGNGAPQSSLCLASGSEPCSTIIASGVPVRNGYEFLGWAESSSASSVTYSAGDEIVLNSNKTLYAVWKKETSPDDPADPDDPVDPVGPVNPVPSDGEDEEKPSSYTTPNTGKNVNNNDAVLASASFTLPILLVVVSMSMFIVRRVKKHCKFD